MSLLEKSQQITDLYAKRRNKEIINVVKNKTIRIIKQPIEKIDVDQLIQNNRKSVLNIEIIIQKKTHKSNSHYLDKIVKKVKLIFNF